MNELTTVCEQAWPDVKRTAWAARPLNNQGLPDCFPHHASRQWQGLGTNNAIVIIDDDPDDASIIKRTLLSLHPKCPVLTMGGGQELKDYLQGNSPFYADRSAHPLPALILLDLRMPEINGLEVLDWIKRESHYAKIPVIAISSFDGQRAIRKSYQMGAVTFLSKPIDATSFRDAVRGLKLPIEFD